MLSKILGNWTSAPSRFTQLETQDSGGASGSSESPAVALPSILKRPPVPPRSFRTGTACRRACSDQVPRAATLVQNRYRVPPRSFRTVTVSRCVLMAEMHPFNSDNPAVVCSVLLQYVHEISSTACNVL